MANILRRNEGGVPDLRREIDRLFEDFFSPGGMGMSRAAEFVPRLEVSETEHGYLLRAELPGMTPEDVELNVDNHVLTVSGEKTREDRKQGRGYAYSECSYGGFTRSIQLPPGTDASKIQADFKHGVLEVQIPTREAARPRRIAVSGKTAELPQREAGATAERRAAESAGAAGKPASSPRAQH